MQKTPVLDFFLGALAPFGFRGWFRAAADEPHQTPWLIKAGPGCGKSTLMRRLLAAAPPAPAGGWNERLHCSSDPGSLDGVRLPGARALFLDATAPHTLDSKYPGAAERVLSLYDTLDAASLAAHRADILALGARHAALMQQAADKGVNLLLPVDNVVADRFDADADHKVVKSSEIPAGWQGMDIGPETVKLFSETIVNAKTVIWNGPMGVFEFPAFAEGTKKVAEACAACKGTTIIGGGDSASAVKKLGFADKMTHISTGGGASLEFLEGKVLPGVAVLNDK